MAVVFSEKESVFFVGGRGTKAGDANAGGGCTKTYWGDLKSPNKVLSDVMDTNGEPVSAAAAWNGSQTACTVVDNGSGLCRITLASAFADVEVGHIANIDFADATPDGRYEVIAEGYDWFDINLSYSSTTCDAKVGGAFPTQQEALDDTDAGNYTVNILTNKARNDVGLTVDVDTGGGEASAYNSWKRVIGVDADGVELAAGSYVTIEAMYDIDCYNIGDVDNIEFRHIFTYYDSGSPTEAGWKDTGVAFHYGLSFIDCKSEGFQFGIELYEKKRHVQILGGYFVAEARVVVLSSVSDAVIRGAILENSSGFALVQIWGLVCMVADGCVFIKAGSGAAIGQGGYGLVKVTNSVFYNVDDGIYLNYENSELIEYNNIYYLYDQANSLMINRQAGAILYSNYSCAWTAGGTPTHADRWGGMGKPEHAIEENPLFVDAGGGDFRPRNPNVLRGGLPDIDDNPSQMGVILQKYQFVRRARGANVGRLQIIR